MPVYHFTLHAYRSWSPGHPRGYTRRGKGYLPSDPEMAQKYDDRAKHPKAQFSSRDIQEVLIVGAIDLCRNRGWRLHAAGTDPTHLHLIVSWKGFLDWRVVRQKTKNLLSLFLGRATEDPGRQWFVRDGSRKRVTSADHLKYLIETYLPDHRGVFWREGQPEPPDRFNVLAPRSK